MNLKFCCSLLQTSELLSPSIYRGCLWVWRDDQVKSTHAGFFLDTSFPFTPHATVGSPSNYSAKLSPNAVSARPAFLFIPRQIIFRSFSPCLAPRARNSLPSLFTARNFQPFLFTMPGIVRVILSSFRFLILCKFRLPPEFSDRHHLGLHDLYIYDRWLAAPFHLSLSLIHAVLKPCLG
jgi:hypothetical protein